MIRAAVRDAPTRDPEHWRLIFELQAVRATLASERNAILASRGYDPVPDGIAVFRFDDRD